MLLSPTIGAFSVFDGHVGRRQRQPRVVGELGRELPCRKLVAVAEQARESDFAGDPALEGTDAGRHAGRAWDSAIEPEQGMNENGTP